MLAALGLLAAGGVLLYAGAEAATRGASSLTRALRVPAFVLGALAFGIDLEGLATATGAAARGDSALAAGTVFGSVLFLFGGAFGSALIFSKRPFPSPSPTMVLAPAIPLTAAATAIADRYVARLEGALLILLYAAYVGLLVRERTLLQLEASTEPEPSSRPRSGPLIALTIGGLVALAAGSGFAVNGAERLLAQTGLRAGFFGAAVLGILISIDEVLLQVLPSRRGDPELATGNLFGTLAAFCSGVLGTAALVRPIDVDSVGALALLGAAVLYAVVATVFLARGRAGWGVGLFLLAFYGMWLVTAADV